jgi:hypothetical protein
VPLTTSELEAQLGQAPTEGPVSSATGDVLREPWLRAVQEHNRLTQDYNEQIQKDYQYRSKGLIPDIIHSGKFALDLTNRFLAAREAAGREFVAKPIQDAVTRLGELVQDHLAAEDYGDMEARREGKRGQEYPKGIDWKVHKADVARTVEGLNSAIEDVVYMLSVGGLGKPGKPGTPKAKLSLAESERASGLTPDPKEFIKPSKKPRLRIVGETEEGKPRVRIQTPEETSAGVSQTMREVMSPKSINEQGPDATGLHPISQLYREWLGPHANTLDKMRGAYERGIGLGAHQLIDSLMGGARDGYVKNFLSRLKGYIDDVPVNFVDNVVDRQTGETHSSWGGQYDTLTHQIDIRFNPQSTDMTRVLVHELTHAATHRFIIQHPDHPLVQELEGLLSEARHRAGQNPAWKDLYGLTNSSEFLAEAMSKPAFQTFLAKSAKYASEGWKGAGDLFHELARIIQRMFGIPDGPEASLLHGSMESMENIMKAQAKEKYSFVKDAKGKTWMTSSPKDIKIPKVATDNKMVKKLGQWIDDAARAVNPEGRGPSAKLAGAMLAHRVTEYAQRSIAILNGSTERTGYWQKNPQAVTDFIRRFETGGQFTDPEMKQMASAYKTWAEDIYNRDTRITRLKYAPVDNYLPHLFEERDRDDITNLFNERHGTKWGNPKFIKERGFSLYQEAVAAGFKPKYSNPEEMMLARQRASDMASLQTSLLEDLWDNGLATLHEKGTKQPKGTSPRRAPNGDIYYVDNKAFQVLHNYFDTKSFWSDRSAIGSTYRGMMWLKNGMVPIKLGLSGFHPLHIMLGIDNSAAIARTIESASVEGGIVRAPAKVFASWLTNFLPWKSVSTNPYYGGRLIRAFDSREAAGGLKDYEKEFVQRALEGGFNPHLHFAYQQAGIRTIRGELQRLGANSTWRLPLAVINTLSRRLMFEKWIPALKAQSYNLDVQNALKMDPTLLDDDARRIQRFTAIRKSVDNRYGEMNYDTLFWNRRLKDVGVLSTLSMGWQLGFIREFGGGTLDLAKYGATLHRTGRVERLAQGDLHKAIYGVTYMANVALYGGLMTWAMSGKAPESLEDYVFPRTGETNPDGTPGRVTTMFYTREPAMVTAHVREQGLFGGIGSLAASKSSGVFGALAEFATGLSHFNQETRDPDGSYIKQLQQTLAHALGELEPISIQNIQDIKGQPGQAARSLLGFTPAPKYLTDSPVESEIKSDFRKYVAGATTSYDKALYSQEYSQLRKLYAAGDPAYEDVLDKMADEHELSDKQRRNIVKSLDDETTPLQRMFGRLEPKQQKRLLDKMTDEEREQYLPHARKQLKDSYEPPSP